MVRYVLLPATSEAGARRQLEQYFMSYLSNYFCCSTLVIVLFRSLVKIDCSGEKLKFFAAFASVIQGVQSKKA
jgi:hypothetical protein